MKLPDGPKTPALLQLINWIARPYEYLEECREKYGDVFTLRMVGLPPLVFISDPRIIQKIFNTDAKDFDAGRSNIVVLPLIGDNSILLMDGSRHKKERKLLMPPFHGEKVKSYAETICQITETVASGWEVNKPFLARRAMQDITLDVIVQTVFGLSAGQRYQEIKPLLAEWLDTVDSPARSSFLFLKFVRVDLGPWSPWGDFIRKKQTIYNLLQAEIEARRANPEKLGDDILSLMLCATDEEGQPMSDDRLKDELMTLLIGGQETTATSLAWAFYWLAKYPQVKERLLQEIDSLGENPDPIAISRLPYLTAVCQEILRIYPVVPIVSPRIAKKDIETMGYKFPAETSLVPSIYSTHHREDLYPNPKEFKPERFLERQYSPYEFIPFGGGVRVCLGYALGMLELKLVIATVLAKYELALVDNKPIKPTRRGLTTAPSNGVPIVMTGLRETKKAIALN